ncbi:hypothetical protein [Kitasatospora sp. MAP5-34]|uniref:hypothetical protein n=1 Tax=Kitasatospora sp. MAP5-34 TaxID=3035102 RepID=UPI002476F753|nr:hypothetical protein [Kitasatospora sp. MAP5-34]MDH6580027.1 hypothetical protein [Kitasatospora sp. MAP5-34]
MDDDEQVSVLQRHQAAAEEAVIRLRSALALLGIPPLVSLDPDWSATGTLGGGHVYLGGCGVYTANMIADALINHARCIGRVVPGDAVPTVREVEAVLRGELPRADDRRGDLRAAVHEANRRSLGPR